MTLNYTQQVADIKARIASNVTNARIVDTLDDYPITNGVIQPHIVLNFGGPAKKGSGGGIVGASKDPHIMWCHVHCVALTIAAARSLKGDVLDALTEFHPTRSGEMVTRGGYDQTLKDSDNAPIRFDEVARFEFTYNL